MTTYSSEDIDSIAAHAVAALIATAPSERYRQLVAWAAAVPERQRVPMLASALEQLAAVTLPVMQLRPPIPTSAVPQGFRWPPGRASVLLKRRGAPATRGRRRPVEGLPTSREHPADEAGA